MAGERAMPVLRVGKAESLHPLRRAVRWLVPTREQAYQVLLPLMRSMARLGTPMASARRRGMAI